MDKILDKKYIKLDVDIKTKQELFTYVAELLHKNEIVTNEKEFIKGLNEREKQSPTGFENHIAIPHVQSHAVTKPTLTIIRTTQAVSDYESLDPSNQVRLIFLIAVPKLNENNEHLKILSELSTKLLDKELVDKLLDADEDTIISLLSEEKKETQINGETKGLILAVTACATGIAHTYMSAEAIEKQAKEMGYDVKVEKQAAGGIEDAITKEDVANADAVIFAHDVALKGLNKFEGLKYVDTKVAKPLHEPEKIITDALNSTKVYKYTENEEDSSNENQSIFSEMLQAILTGISYMIPVIVAGGLLIGIANIFALLIGGQELVSNLAQAITLYTDPENVDLEKVQIIMEQSNFTRGLVTFLAYLNAFGGLTLKFMYPMFAGYTAYSIGQKNALLPGFIGGVFAAGLHVSLLGLVATPAGILAPFVEGSTITPVPGGFLSAIILGLVAGYMVRFLNNNIKLSKNLMPLKTMLIVPGVSIFVVVTLNLFIVEPIFVTLNIAIQNFITAHQSSEYVYSALVAGATAFDLGGPINKAAGTVALGLNADGVFPLTARVLAIVIPPIGIGLSTVIAKIVTGGKNVFSTEEKTLGTSAMILGVIGISEGAIPFMIKRPLVVIPINIIGAILGSLVAISLGAVQTLPLPAIWGWPLVQGIGAYMIGMICGVVFIAIAHSYAVLALENRKKSKK